MHRTLAEGNYHGFNQLINGTEGDAACWKVCSRTGLRLTHYRLALGCSLAEPRPLGSLITFGLSRSAHARRTPLLQRALEQAHLIASLRDARTLVWSLTAAALVCAFSAHARRALLPVAAGRRLCHLSASELVHMGAGALDGDRAASSTGGAHLCLIGARPAALRSVPAAASVHSHRRRGAPAGAVLHTSDGQPCADALAAGVSQLLARRKQVGGLPPTAKE